MALAYRFKARSTTPGADALKQAAIAVVADYPAVGKVTGVTFGNGSLAGTRIDCPVANAEKTGTPFYGDPAALVDGLIDTDAIYGLGRSDQLGVDQSIAVTNQGWIAIGHGFLGATGGYPLSATSEAIGAAAQLVTDKAAVNAQKASILNTATILTIPGTFDLTTWESARNTNPGVAHVEDGTTYLIRGIDYEGTLESGGGYFPQPPLVSTSGIGDLTSVCSCINAVLVSATAVTGVGGAMTPICDDDGDPVPVFNNIVPKEEANTFPRIVFFNLPTGRTGRVFRENNVERYNFQLSVQDNFLQGDPTQAQRIHHQAILALEKAKQSGFTMTPDELTQIIRPEYSQPGQNIDTSASTIHVHVDMFLEVQRAST